MSQAHPQDPLHGVTLKALLEDLVARRGWQDLANQVPVRCFSDQPSVSSSLKFLRKTAWARAKVEQLYLRDRREHERKQARNKRRAARRAYKASLGLAEDAALAGVTAPPAGAGAGAGAAGSDTTERD